MDYSIAKGLTTPLLFTHKGPIYTSSAFAVGTPVLGCPKPIIDIRSNSDTAGAVSLRALNSCPYLHVGRLLAAAVAKRHCLSPWERCSVGTLGGEGQPPMLQFLLTMGNAFAIMVPVALPPWGDFGRKLRERAIFHVQHLAFASNKKASPPRAPHPRKSHIQWGSFILLMH